MKTTILRLTDWFKSEGANCGLHPLIHTFLKLNLAQDMAVCQREEREAPTDQSSNQTARGGFFILPDH